MRFPIFPLLVLCVFVVAGCSRQSAPSTESTRNGERTRANDSASGDQTDSKTKKYLSVDEKDLKGVIRTNLDSPNPTKAQLARRERSIGVVKEMGLPFIDHLPVVEDDQAVKLRSSEDVAKRCLAITICAIKGETNDQAFVDEVIKDYSASDFFSPKELRFIKGTQPKKQDLVDFSWQYECTHVLLWALQIDEKLAPPHEICVVTEEMKRIKNLGPKDFVSKAKLRTKSEILNMADLYYRLHWAAIDLRLKGKSSEKINEGIIRERHRALNWLIRYMNEEWDNVTTDT